MDDDDIDQDDDIARPAFDAASSPGTANQGVAPFTPIWQTGATKLSS